MNVVDTTCFTSFHLWIQYWLYYVPNTSSVMAMVMIVMRMVA